MKVGFTGTQKGMTTAQKEKLIWILRGDVTRKPSLFIHGGCVGADNEADVIAAELGIERLVFPSNLVHKSVSVEVLRARGPVFIAEPQPPLKRNIEIVKHCEWLIACPAEMVEIMRSGTWMTVRQAAKQKRNHHVIGRDGNFLF
jgi:hypothetical protein